MRQMNVCAALAMIGFSGCFSSASPPIDIMAAPDATVVDVVIQHGPRFDRYHLVREILWQECGDVQEDAFAPAETHVSVLNETERNTMLRRFNAVLARVAEDPEELPAVEKGDSDLIQISVRQESAENKVVVPERATQGTPSGTARIVAQLVSSLNKKKALNCGAES